MKHRMATALLAVLCIAGFGTGCSRSYTWRPDRKPETPEERATVAKETVAILAAIPVTKLEGHDQDSDDAITAAKRAAMETHCKTRLYEWENYCGSTRQTGRVKEVQP